MKKNSRIFAAFLVCALLAGLLSGCGEKQICDSCGKSFRGKAYTDWTGEAILCRDCAADFWMSGSYNSEKVSGIDSGSSPVPETGTALDETQQSTDGEAYQSQEYGFVPDYAPGRAETMSHPPATHNYWEFSLAKGYSYLLRQDQMIYFIAPSFIKDSPNSFRECERLCKIPVGGGPDDIITILPDLDELDGAVREMQIVGDWIYLFCDISTSKTASMMLCRVRTDGSVIQTLADDILNSPYNTVIVKDGAVYYISIVKEQVSASRQTEKCELKKLRLTESGAGGEEILFTTAEGVDDLHIESYNKDAAIFISKENVYMFDMEREEVYTPSAEFIKMVEGNNTRVFPGRGGEFLLYQNYRGMLFLCRPETQYRPEKYLEIGIALSRYSGTATSVLAEFLVLEDGSIVSNYRANVNESYGIWLLKNGERSLIVQDRAIKLSYPGDGYLYYVYDDYTLCRIRLDGTGWEQLDY